jgi:hypothetical protein
MAEHLDGLRLTQVPVKLDHKPLSPPKSLAQNGFGEPGGPNGVSITPLSPGTAWAKVPPMAIVDRIPENQAFVCPTVLGTRATDRKPKAPRTTLLAPSAKGSCKP